MQRIAAALLVLGIATVPAGCRVIEGIFKVGLWAGIILVILIVVVIWLVVRLFR